MAGLGRAMERRLLAALRLRRRDSVGQSVDRSALYVGAAYTFCCSHCGSLGEAWSDYDAMHSARTCCDDCSWLTVIGFDFPTCAFLPVPPLPVAMLALFFDYARTLPARVGSRLAEAEYHDSEFHLDVPVI